MSVAFDGTIKNRDIDTKRAAKPRALIGLARVFGHALLFALGGLMVGMGILKTTNVFQLIPQDGSQVWVQSGCAAADAALRASLHSPPEKPIFLIPLDQGSEMTQTACRSTLAALDHEGYWWLRYFPEKWLCQRLADDAKKHFNGEPIPIPRFYAGGKLICEGLCEGAFERLGHPEIQQFVTFIH